MFIVERNSANELFAAVCIAVLGEGREVSPRGMPTREIRGAQLCLTEPRRRFVDVAPARMLNPAVAVRGPVDPVRFGRSMDLRIQPQPGTVQRQRAAPRCVRRRWAGVIQDVLRAWQLEHLAGLVDAMVAEMVLNAVRYSSTHVAVILRTVGGYLVIDVWDAGLRPSAFVTPSGRARDAFPVTKALADKWEVVAAERGGRLVRVWIAKCVRPDVLTIEQQLRAVIPHSASLLAPAEKPTPEMITRVIEGLRALNVPTRAATTPAEDGPRRFAREG